MVARGHDARDREREIAALARNVVLVVDLLDVVPARDRRAPRRRRRDATPSLDRAAYQVLALIAPFLVGDAAR